MNTEGVPSKLLEQLNALEKEFQKFLSKQWEEFRNFITQRSLASGILDESTSILALLGTFYQYCLRQFQKQIDHTDLNAKEKLALVYLLQKSFREIVKKAEVVKTSFEVEGEIEYG